uniref:Uncharacterized protein n=1 Tax=Nothoprocta perdicaria TaxID=30464 RepID=A0A8C6YQX2_NOTPE
MKGLCNTLLLASALVFPTLGANNSYPSLAGRRMRTSPMPTALSQNCQFFSSLGELMISCELMPIQQQNKLYCLER